MSVLNKKRSDDFLKIIITDDPRHHYISKCTDKGKLYKTIKSHYEKEAKKVYVPLTFLAGLCALTVCFIVNHNIEIEFDSKKKYYDVKNNLYLWAKYDDFQLYKDDTFYVKPSVIMSFNITHAVGFARLLTDKLIFNGDTYRVKFKPEKLNNIFCIEFVYAYWEYLFMCQKTITEYTITHNCCYNKQAIDWLITNNRIKQTGQLFHFIGDLPEKELYLL